MTGLLVGFGLLIMLAGCVLLAKPESIIAPLRDNVQAPELQIAAVLVRLMLGYLLISQAAMSKFPLVIEVLGWLSVAAAIVLAAIGRDNFTRLMSWAVSLAKTFGRASGFVAIVFGVFLVYAFV